MVDLGRYLALFLADGREHLKLASAGLLDWEQRPAELAPVAEVFRAFHSLKSSAATMGYQDIVTVAHGAEHLLEAIRRRELPGSKAVIGILFRAVDTLERGLEPATRGEPLSDAAALAEAMERLASTATPSLTAPERRVEPTARAAARPTMRAVRVDPARLDELLQLAGELVVARNRLVNATAGQADPETEAATGQIDSLVRALHGGVLRARLAPITELFGRFPRVVRDLGGALGKAARLELTGEGIELDRTVLEELVDPLIHLIRNAVDHGIESPEDRQRAGKPAAGRLELAAERRRDWIVITLSDDGRGIDRAAVLARARDRGLLAAGAEGTDEEILGVLALPGFTMKGQVTEVSGRGVGMDAVLNRVRALGGRVDWRSAAGVGTTFEITVPMTAAIQRVLLVGAGSERFAIPFRRVREAVAPGRKTETTAGGIDRFTFREKAIRCVDLAEVSGGTATAAAGRRPVLMLEWGAERGALAVDRLLGQHDVLLERFEAPRSLPPWVSGATILADGQPAFLLDPTALF
ncbi:MAG: chemotaxis protein CheA [Gemmatimonadales bacterium]